jgi:hypothetical protein
MIYHRIISEGLIFGTVGITAFPDSRHTVCVYG